MKTKILFLAGMTLASAAAWSQETYENTNLVDNDLNGTARYVGMGGAMDALGADISTIGTNPAGIGMFRKSQFAGSFGMVSQQDAESFASGNKTNLSFDQIGFVYSTRSGRNSFLNLAFNYHKSRNFDQILAVAGSLETTDRYGNKQYGSQNKLTYEKLREGLLYEIGSDGLPLENRTMITHSQLDHLYYNGLTKYQYDDGNVDYGYYDASAYTFNKAMSGYIGEYDFNISGNIDNRVYLGLTVGIHDVHYKGYSEYAETYLPNQDNIQSVTAVDNREITGTGFDIKAGVIFRPVEDSPFRIGVSVATPTWYDLNTSNYTYLTDGSAKIDNGESYDFKLYTPWKFGLSLGHTIGNYLALGAGYEYADYSSMDTRVIDGGYYGAWYDGYYEESSSDKAMNRHTKNTLKGVSTLKLGMEFKPDPTIAVRFGYNYVSPMFKMEGFKDGTIDSEGSYYASSTDYVNWKSTNRVTCGIGYNVGNMNFDVAYQYNVQNGEFHPFMDSYADWSDDPGFTNYADAVKVSNKHHQLVFTMGYRF